MVSLPDPVVLVVNFDDEAEENVQKEVDEANEVEY
jgi:hypothetical protein